MSAFHSHHIAQRNVLEILAARLGVDVDIVVTHLFRKEDALLGERLPLLAWRRGTSVKWAPQGMFLLLLACL